jgi:hypothetical protein
MKEAQLVLPRAEREIGASQDARREVGDMRRFAIRSAAVTLLGVLVAAMVVSDPHEAQASAAGTDRGYTLTVDPRIELLAVVQHFSSWAPGGHIKSSTTYKQDVDGYFAEFSGHRAVAMVESLVAAGFTHDAPVAFMLHHTDPPELALRHLYSDYLVDRAGGEEHLERFADALRDFARASDFMQFYDQHRDLYDLQVAEVEELTSGLDYVGTLQTFFGDSRKSYGIILSPLFAGGYGITVLTDDGHEIYGVLGPCALRDSRVTFACLDYIESISLHEWSHSFVNPLVDANYARFEQSEPLYAPIAGMMRIQAYPTWRIALYEHIVRASEIHLRDRLREDFDKGKFLNYQEGKGFWYIARIDSLLGVYEEHRNRYAALADFMPVIADELAEVSVDDIPDRLTVFSGPLDALFPMARSVHIVYPADVEGQTGAQLEREVRGFASFLSSMHIEPVIVTDEEARGLDWSDKVGFVFATPVCTELLGELDPGIPVAFTADGLRFGDRIYGEDGVSIVTCLPNPDNAELPFALVLANRPEDLIGTSMRMGSRSDWNADYVIFHGAEVVETGRYAKGAGNWTLLE